MKFPLKYIGELLAPTQVNSAEQCRVICTVYEIDRDWGWYYFGCKSSGCDKKVIELSTTVKKVNGKDVVSHVWWCEGCKRKVYDVSPRFKLHLLVKDDTGIAHFMLLDSVAKGIVPETPETLLNGSFDELEDIDSFPEAINSLVGKTFMFGVFIDKDHVTCKSEIYKVGKVWKDTRMVLSGAASGSCTQSDLETTIGSGEQDSLLLTDNQSSDDMLSTPSSKRKEESNEDVPDLTSTSKKQHTYNIKKESTGQKNSKKSG
ncbi:unnamed protein product [Brassica napus]|uniref:(rape) hypothetical protein n=1 Tax=Brassica napus TaxID=3708 RepID=A0A816L5R2_BRANA|nr:unnamed protein product [Brassica napus]